MICAEEEEEDAAGVGGGDDGGQQQQQAARLKRTPEEEAERQQRTVFVGNLPVSVKAKALRKLFSQCAPLLFLLDLLRGTRHLSCR
jgi:RNA recognition motif-containing protein